MPAAIGSPALCNFVENNLRAIYEATTMKAFENAFDKFFSHELDVTINGEASTRESYKQRLWGECPRERSAMVNFLGLLAVPGDNEHLTGTVGVFLTAMISSMPPSGRPTRERVTASYRLIIEQQASSVEPTSNGDSGRPREIEMRRVASVDVVVNAKEGSEDLLSAL